MEKSMRWIFFDIGSTLTDETEAYFHRLRDMIQNTDISLEEYLEVRDSYDRQGMNGDQKAIERFRLTKTEWHSEDETPFADCENTLRTLCERGYRLGVIANQKDGLEKRLEEWGLTPYLSVIASSAELGVSKPDPAIFRKALEVAGCEAKQACMVGDRPDNDIGPAKKLGMRTVRMKKGRSVFKNPQREEERADVSVNSLTDLLDIFL